jgi:hypothetical protein
MGAGGNSRRHRGGLLVVEKRLKAAVMSVRARKGGAPKEGILKPDSKVAATESAAIERGTPPLVFALIAATAGAACYFNAMNGDFVFDDKQAIVRNPDVCTDAPLADVVYRSFQNDFWGMPLRSERSHKSYRPLTVLSFHANYLLGGLNTTGYHAVNIGLHSLCCFLLVIWCTSCLRISKSASALAGLLYAVHPIHTEAVSGVVGRADLLCCAFVLLSMISYGCSCHTTSGTITRCLLFASSLVSAVAAVLCKEVGIAVLPICIVFDLLHTLGTAHPMVLMSSLIKHKPNADRWLVPRMSILLGFTIIIICTRYHANGGSPPAFSTGSNPGE